MGTALYDNMEPAVYYFKRMGEYLLEDDADDFGDMSRLHHWQYGLAMYLFGEVVELKEMIDNLLNSGVFE